MEERGCYTTTLTASNDITTHLVQLQSPEDQAIDFGHADLFLASKPGGDAETLVWQPILDWIMARQQTSTDFVGREFRYSQSVADSESAPGRAGGAEERRGLEW